VKHAHERDEVFFLPQNAATNYKYFLFKKRKNIETSEKVLKYFFEQPIILTPSCFILLSV